MGAISIRAWAGPLFGELMVRLLLFGVFWYSESMTPFVRYVTAASLESDYKHPRRDSYVSARVMWVLVLSSPCAVAAVALCRRDREDAAQSFLAVTLALCINGVITNTVKLVAGRLRPDFFYRCFPDGVSNLELTCTGDADDIAEGRKSFPSGHSSLSFCSLGFVSIWLCGLLRVCGEGARGGGGAVRTVAALVPLYMAMLIALSRTCDYHHHWEDVVAGSTLGLGTAYCCYRQRYPPLTSPHSGVPLLAPNTPLSTPRDTDRDSVESEPLVSGDDRKETKWI